MRICVNMIRVRCILVLLLLASTTGCANTEYRFERIDGDRSITLPLKLNGFNGRRDGATVSVEARFDDGADRLRMNFSLFLRPPAEFRSGTFEATIGGETTSGTVECQSLTFFGGQTASPTVGGVFVLRDRQNRPVYRIQIPATGLQ